MRLAVLNLTGSGMSGGYRNYLRNILPRLASDERVEALLCCSPAALRVEAWLPGHEKIQFAACAPFRPFTLGPERALDLALTNFQPDVLFVPTARAVRFRSVPVVTMIQNMAPLGSWRAYGPAEWPRLVAQWLESRRAVRQADGIVAISDFVRQFLLRKWSVESDRIALIYFGAPSPNAHPLRPAQLPSDWNKFIFTAGSLEPYRSLEDLIDCAAISRHRMGRPLRVVLAGSARESMKSYESRLKAMAEKAGVSGDLCWVGQLSSEEMTWCYKNSAAFVMTSRVEALPNTVLEAMANGSVCIAADNPPLPELFAETALYYGPGNAKILAEKVAEVLSWDGASRASASAAARERAETFSWETAAKSTVDLMFRVSATPRSR